MNTSWDDYAHALQDSEGNAAIHTVYLASTAADGRVLFWDYSFVLTYDRCCRCNVIVDEESVNISSGASFVLYAC